MHLGGFDWWGSVARWVVAYVGRVRETHGERGKKCMIYSFPTTQATTWRGARYIWGGILYKRVLVVFFMNAFPLWAQAGEPLPTDKHAE